jgi:hypothetical protein
VTTATRRSSSARTTIQHGGAPIALIRRGAPLCYSCAATRPSVATDRLTSDHLRRRRGHRRGEARRRMACGRERQQQEGKTAGRPLSRIGPRAGDGARTPRPSAWEAVPRPATLDNEPRRTPATMRVFGVLRPSDPHGCAARFWIVWGMNGARGRGSHDRHGVRVLH